MPKPSYSVGMGDIHVAKGPAIYQCIGLGSCIGLALYDSASEVSGMIHIVLPEAPSTREMDKVGKYADTGFVEIVRMMRDLGADPRRLKAAYSGGASLFKFGNNPNVNLNIGERNSNVVQVHLKGAGIGILASDVGGESGRTMVFDAETGVITVRTLHKSTVELTNMRGRTASALRAA
ncbi:MAG: chemotaxis protein CheD [Armatimonadetes bacterium]|nr:chemotaxis protein CheD [Armatimonadota bacterium]